MTVHSHCNQGRVPGSCQTLGREMNLANYGVPPPPEPLPSTFGELVGFVPVSSACSTCPLLELFSQAEGAVGTTPRLVKSIMRETNQANMKIPPWAGDHTQISFTPKLKSCFVRIS